MLPRRSRVSREPEQLTLTKQLMYHPTPPNSNWVQLSIFDLRHFHDPKKEKVPTKKRCTRCQKLLPFDKFGNKKAKGCKYGINNHCKACCCEIEKLRRLSQKPKPEKPVTSEGYKKCSKCKEILLTSNFYKLRVNSICSWCKSCEAKRGKEKYARGKNRGHKEPAFAYKQCAQCKRYQEVESFFPDADSFDGLASSCHPCRRKIAVKSAYKNRAKVSYASRKRRLLKINATPSWVNHEEIVRLHGKAVNMTRETGTKYELDHILPLKNKLICGFHVTKNLQILTKSENSRKNNRFTPYVWSELTPQQQQDPLFNPFWREDRYSRH